jgi:hypothetical protein
MLKKYNAGVKGEIRLIFTAALTVCLLVAFAQVALATLWTITPGGIGNGTVTSSGGTPNFGWFAGLYTGSFNDGTTVTFTATPFADYYFSGWLGSTCGSFGTNPNCIVLISGSPNVWATFTHKPILSANIPGNGVLGSVSSGCVALWCYSSHTLGSTTSLTGIPNAGRITSWTGSCDSIVGNTCNVTMTGDKTVYLDFVLSAPPPPSSYVITAAKAGTGSGTVMSSVGGINCGVACSSAATAAGTAVTLTATPVGGSTFAGWVGGGCVGVLPCSTTFDSTKTVTATFNLAVATATLNVIKVVDNTGNPSAFPPVPGNFSLTVKSGGVDVPGSPMPGLALPGRAYTLGAGPYVVSETANPSFVKTYSGNCDALGNVTLVAGSTYTCTITNKFLPTYALSATLAANGTITSTGGTGSNLACGGTCSVTKTSGNVVVLTATPAVGYSFSGWGGACAGVVPCTLTMNSAKAVTAAFTLIPPATLNVVTVVDFTNGGGFETKNVSDYSVRVKLGAMDVPSSPANGVIAPGKPYTLAAGTYSVSTTAAPGYALTYGGGCDAAGNVILAAGDVKTCTVTNTYVPSTINVVTVVDNTGGGSAVASDFIQHVRLQDVYDIQGMSEISLFNRPYGVAADSSGNVYVVDRNNNRIQKYSSTGTYISKIGTAGTGNGQLYYPQGIAVSLVGNIYVADTGNNRIQMFDNTGTYVRKWGSMGIGNGQFQSPTGIAVSSTNLIYVADSNNDRIQIFNSAGVYLAQWGTHGTGNGQFDNPLDVTTDFAGNVYVADSNNYRIQKFSNVGVYLSQWGTAGTGKGQFNFPMGIKADSGNNIYVTDYLNFRVQKFNSAGVFIMAMGRGVKTGVDVYETCMAVTPVCLKGLQGANDDIKASFNGPNGIGVDSAAGTLYVSDGYPWFPNNRVMKFNSTTGALITQWGWASIVNPATGSLTGNKYTLKLNNYRITQNANPLYTTTIGGDCVGGSISLLNPGLSKTCTVTNKFIAPVPITGTLNVVTAVSGGTAVPSDFNLHVKLAAVDAAGSPAPGLVAPGKSYTLNAGTYNVSGEVDPSYTASYSGDCGAVPGLVILLAGETKTCTVTFTYFVAPPVPIPPLPASATCYDVSGVGKYIPVGGVYNSGKIYFDQIAGKPSVQYGVCVVDPGDDWLGPFYVKGWAWNDNLGWISFYCGDEDNNPVTGYTNMGVSCGGILYGVTIDNAGTFDGYAWGDNVSYISFKNGSNSQLRLEPTDAKCQGYIYGATAPIAGCVTTPNHGFDPASRKWTHVWADSVGWIDLDTVHFPWYALTKSIKNVKVTLIPDPRTAVNPGSAYAVTADGSSAYKLDVSIIDKSLAPVVAPQYTVTIVPTWGKDRVKKDQIDTTKKLETLSTPCTLDISGQRAVVKPCNDLMNPVPAGLSYDSGTIKYSASISSVGPTSNENQSQKIFDGKYFSNESFILPKAKNTDGREPNDLILTGVGVKVWDTIADQCAYADDWTACTPKTVAINSDASPVNFRFKPATTFTINNPDTGSEDFISAYAGSTKKLAMQKAGTGSIALTSGIDPDDGAYAYGFVDTQENVKYSDLITPQPITFPYPNGKDLWSLFVAQITGKPAAQYISGLYVYSEITESGGVKYYGNKLPRVIGSFATQPVAVTTGNVYGTCLAQTTKTTGDIRSLGDISSNKLRDTFARNVAAITAGIVNNGGSDVTISSSTLSSCSATGALSCAANGKVIYVKGNAILQEDVTPGAGTISWTGNKTIVVVGGYLKINSNILPAGAGAAKPRLGIIVMKDYTNTAESKMAGNIYVESKVLDIQANIVAADGALLSYEIGRNINSATGMPNFTGTADMTAALKDHQLWITGSLASNNTLGGGTADKDGHKFDGLCRVTTDAVVAQLYDLNFLRQYVGELRRDINGTPTQQDGGAAPADWSSNALLDANGKPIAAVDGGYLYPPVSGTASLQNTDVPRNLGSTYLVFDPPPATLPGFAGENIFAVVIRTQ